jgi:hypothetical protein
VASPTRFWLSLGLTHAEGWLLLIAAVVRLRRNWPESAPVSLARSEPRAMKLPLRELMDSNPVYWLALRLRDQPALIWAGVGLVLIHSLAFPLLAGVAGGSMSLAAGTWESVHLLLSLGWAAVFAWAAGKFLFGARRDGQLELLLSTPLGARHIVVGCWWALWWQLRAPLLLVAFVMLVQFLLTASAGLANAVGVFWLYGFQSTMFLINRVLDVIAVCWVGMWFGLRAPKPSLALLWTVGLVIGLPTLVFYLLRIALVGARTLTNLGGGDPFPLLLSFGIWPVLWLAKDLFFIRWSAARLSQELRTTAPLAVGEWFE